MEIEKIVGLIYCGVLILALIGLLIACVVLTWKSEKEFRQLRNDELSARIKFYQEFVHYLNEL